MYAAIEQRHDTDLLGMVVAGFLVMAVPLCTPALLPLRAIAVWSLNNYAVCLLLLPACGQEGPWERAAVDNFPLSWYPVADLMPLQVMSDQDPHPWEVK